MDPNTHDSYSFSSRDGYVGHGGLTRVSKKNPCIFCGHTKRCYTLANEEIIGCAYTADAPNGYRKTLKQPSDKDYTQFALNTDSIDWAARKEEWEERARQRARNEAEADEIAKRTWLSAEQRHPLIRRLSEHLGLTAEHQKMLADRGLLPEQIKAGLFFSIKLWQKLPEWVPFELPGVCLSKFHDRHLNGQGIAIVTFDHQGFASGWQIMNDQPRPADKTADYAKYKWAVGKCPSKLPVGRQELPIQVCSPHSAGRDIYLCEGTLKPIVAAYRHSINTVGASGGNFEGSPEQVKRALEGQGTVIIAMDAGDAVNQQRAAHWQRQIEWLESIGKTVKIAWWGQLTKDGDDIDEIATLEGVKNIAQLEWFEIAKKEAKKTKELAAHEELSTCNKHVAHKRSEARLAPLPPVKPGVLHFVSSPVGTGKTEQLKTVIADWEIAHPGCRVFMIGYRNGLLDNAGERLGFNSYRVGHGQDAVAIASYARLRICLDSLLLIEDDRIPAGSLVILDEVEAILSHGAQGGTTKGRTADIQNRFSLMLIKILQEGGSVIALEDSITDLSIDGLQAVTLQQFPYELLVNTQERFCWDVRMGCANNGQITAHILSCVAKGERVVVPTTTQTFAESLERVAKKEFPDLANRIVRLDANTSPDLGGLKKSPDQYLADNDTRLLIYTSVVESGFSIESFKFDRIIAKFSNLGGRSHIQMLSRVRSNAPRDIFIEARGADASNGYTDPEKILKQRKITANKTSLAQGFGKIEMTAIGSAWNTFGAKLEGRSIISAKYQAELLAKDLRRRGHQVTDQDWSDLIDAFQAARLSIQFKDAKDEIEVEKNRMLFEADGHAIKPAAAVLILHSSDSRPEARAQAKKCMLHQDLPCAELSEEFLMAAVTKDRGQYLKACQLGYFVRHPELAKLIDKEQYTAQREGAHIIYAKVPRLKQKVDLLSPLLASLDALTSGAEYTEDSPEVQQIYKQALKDSYTWWSLTGLNIRESGFDDKGRAINTAISAANKVLKKLGYKCEAGRREGSRGDQSRVWSVINGDCEHRQLINEAMGRKYAERLQLLDAGSVATESNSNITNIKNVTTESYPDEAIAEMAISLQYIMTDSGGFPADDLKAYREMAKDCPGLVDKAILLAVKMAAKKAA